MVGGEDGAFEDGSELVAQCLHTPTDWVSEGNKARGNDEPCTCSICTCHNHNKADCMKVKQTVYAIKSFCFWTIDEQ